MNSSSPSRYSPSQVTSSHSEDDDPGSSEGSSLRSSLSRNSPSSSKILLSKDKAKQRLLAFKASKGFKLDLGKKKLITPAKRSFMADDDDDEAEDSSNPDSRKNENTASDSTKRKAIMEKTGIYLPDERILPTTLYPEAPTRHERFTKMSHTPSMITGMDSFGFVTGKAISVIQREERENFPEMHRVGLTVPIHSWKEMKEKKICLYSTNCNFPDLWKEMGKKFPNDQYAQPLSEMRSEMMMVYSSKELMDPEEREYVEGWTSFMRRAFREREHFTAGKEKIEFPKADCKESNPQDKKLKRIQWSENPKLSTAFFLKRKEVMKQNNDMVNAEILTFIDSCGNIFHKKGEDLPFNGLNINEKDFLEDHSSSYGLTLKKQSEHVAEIEVEVESQQNNIFRAIPESTHSAVKSISPWESEEDETIVQEFPIEPEITNDIILETKKKEPKKKKKKKMKKKRSKSESDSSSSSLTEDEDETKVKSKKKKKKRKKKKIDLDLSSVQSPTRLLKLFEKDPEEIAASIMKKFKVEKQKLDESTSEEELGISSKKAKKERKKKKKQYQSTSESENDERTLDKPSSKPDVLESNTRDKNEPPHFNFSPLLEKITQEERHNEGREAVTQQLLDRSKPKIGPRTPSPSLAPLDSQLTPVSSAEKTVLPPDGPRTPSQERIETLPNRRHERNIYSRSPLRDVNKLGEEDKTNDFFLLRSPREVRDRSPLSPRSRSPHMRSPSASPQRESPRQRMSSRSPRRNTWSSRHSPPFIHRGSRSPRRRSRSPRRTPRSPNRRPQSPLNEWFDPDHRGFSRHHRRFGGYHYSRHRSRSPQRSPSYDYLSEEYRGRRFQRERDFPNECGYRRGYSRRDDSFPDNVISDVDLIASRRAIPLPPDEEFVAATNARANYDISAELLSGNNSRKIASPKRISLDERLEKEHGIKVRDENVQQFGISSNFNVPPPGYLPTGERFTSPGKMKMSFPRQVAGYPQDSSQIHPPNYPKANEPLSNSNHTNLISKPDESQHLRVGNMLQIVPQDLPLSSEKDDDLSGKKAENTEKTVSSLCELTTQPAESSQADSTASNTSVEAQALIMKKMEEVKRNNERREKERQLRREKMAERLAEKDNEASQEVHSSSETTLPAKRILETLESEENVSQDIQSSIEQENPFLTDKNNGEEINPQELSLDALKNRKKTDKIHYISLKPLSKRERKRQQKLAAAKAKVNPKEILAEKQIEEEPEEEFQPRSPVPLPDTSTCKPILVQLGFELTQKRKKVLRYADGILPGQGSPDNSAEEDSDESSPAPTLQNEVEKPKRRKRIIVKIIRTRYVDESSDSDCKEPSPPPGSPPLWHTAEFIERFACKS